MSKPKLTPWFPPNVLPARPGVYQRDFVGIVKYSRFDGRVWMLSDRNWIQASHEASPSGARQPWRGLAKEPKP